MMNWFEKLATLRPLIVVTITQNWVKLKRKYLIMMMVNTVYY